MQGEYVTSTSQDKAKGEEPKVDDKKDERTVPLGEHIQLRQELKELKDQLAQLKPATTPPKTEPQATNTAPAGDDEFRREYRRDKSIRSIQDDLGLTGKLAGLVQDVIDKNSNTSPAEALAIAKMRNPDDFAETTANGFQEGIHGATRPGAGGQPITEPPKDELKQRLEYAATFRGKDKTRLEAYTNNVLGAIAARQVGNKAHQLLPLPKKP